MIDRIRMTIEWVLRNKLAAAIHNSEIDKKYPNRDWDILVILDACRYDVFSEVIWDYFDDGELSQIDSGVGGTPEFVEKHWAEEHHDTVYVTGNVYLSKIADESNFHAVDRVWEDGFDKELRTTRPKTMAERGIKAAKKYPNKRIVIHMMQPHAPFIGDVRIGERSVNIARGEELGKTFSRSDRSDGPYDLLRKGKIDREDVREGYRENLIAAMPSVQRIVKEVDGKTVITSDHGESFGDRAWPIPVPVWAHENGIYIPALTEVPWFVPPYDGRRHIRKDTPESGLSDIETEKVEENLRAFGYL